MKLCVCHILCLANLFPHFYQSGQLIKQHKVPFGVELEAFGCVLKEHVSEQRGRYTNTIAFLQSAHVHQPASVVLETEVARARVALEEEVGIPTVWGCLITHFDRYLVLEALNITRESNKALQVPIGWLDTLYSPALFLKSALIQHPPGSVHHHRKGHLARKKD